MSLTDADALTGHTRNLPVPLVFCAIENSLAQVTKTLPNAIVNKTGSKLKR